MKKLIWLFLLFCLTVPTIASAGEHQKKATLSQTEMQEVRSLLDRFFAAYKKYSVKELWFNIMLEPLDKDPEQYEYYHGRWAAGNLTILDYKLISVAKAARGYLVNARYYIDFYCNGTGEWFKKWITRELVIVKTKKGLRVASFGNQKGKPYGGFWFDDIKF